jgi:sugar/nucleoside kinase (ribokinase family)
MIRLVCIGDLMVDVLAQLPGPLAPGSDTPASITLFGGGAAANVAAWAAGAGAAASYVGRAGDDALGRRAVDELTAAGVDARVELDPDRPTGTCIVLVDPSGERTMVPSVGANAGPGEYPLPDEADWLYLSGYSLLSEPSRAAALTALGTARDRGWSLAVDAASAAPLQGLGAETFLDWLGAHVLLFANADEAAVLTGLEDPVTAAQSLAARTGQAIVKRGADGAVWSDGSGARSVAAVPAAVVDSTGAGDAFAAGFLTCSGDVGDCLAKAVQLAAVAVGQVGGRPVSSSR